MHFAVFIIEHGGGSDTMERYDEGFFFAQGRCFELIDGIAEVRFEFLTGIVRNSFTLSEGLFPIVYGLF